MNSAIRASRYSTRIPNYSLGSGAAARTKKNNGKPVLAKKIIVQSVACILILLSITWLQSKPEDYARDIISQIRLQVVERHFDPGSLYESLVNTYEDCVQYIQGTS